MNKALLCSLLSVVMVSCGQQKKEDAKTRPSAPPVSSQTLAVNGVPVAAIISDIEAFSGPPLEGQTINQISLKLTLGDQSQVLNIVQANLDEQMTYFSLGKYAVSASTRCVSLDPFAPTTCSKFYFVAWFAASAEEIPDSQMGVVKLLDGSKFADGSLQYSVSKIRPEPLLSSQQMSTILDRRN